MAQSNLHGFAVPLFKTWGRKRHPRCMKPRDTSAGWDAGHDPLPICTTPDAGKPSPPLDDGFERIRMKLMAHLRDAADKLNLTLPQHTKDMEDGDGAKAEGEPHPPVAATSTRRRRRRNTHPPRRDPSPSPPPPPTKTRSLRLRSAACAERELRRSRRFSVPLSREEIDEDFYALTGKRAPGRPKRRPPAVRKHLDLLFPGLGLSEITAACYEVAAPRPQSRRG